MNYSSKFPKNHHAHTHIEHYTKAIKGNKKFVEQMTRKDPGYFAKLSIGQHPKYLLIGCSDSRVPPSDLTQTDPGEIFIHRNIANQVLPTDLNLNCVMQYAVEHLKVKNIIVMGHTQCGGIKAAMQQDSAGGLLDLWLNQIKIIYLNHQKEVDRFRTEEERVNCLCGINVREQVMNIWRNPIIQKSWEDGYPVMVHGWLFHLETGYIEELTINSDIPDDLQNIFKLHFHEHDNEERKSSKDSLPPIKQASVQKLNSPTNSKPKLIKKYVKR